MRITQAQSQRVAKKLRINLDKVDIKDFTYGMNVEWEHRNHVGRSMTNVGKIVGDHLREDLNYYKKFRKAGLK
jgi:hypothetical protein